MLTTYMLLAVYGASGSGKSEMMKIIDRVCLEATIHKKFTTRGRRPKESPENLLDLELVKEFDENLCEATYFKYGNYYGIRKDLLEKAYRNKESHFMIVRDINAIRRLKSLHPELKTIYVHADPHNLKRNLQSREGLDMKERIRRINEEFLEFVYNSILFDHVIVNFWDIENASKQLSHIINMYHKKACECLV